jgi:FkbM family methyltransferase
LNPAWLIRNIATSWRRSASTADFVRCLRLVYSGERTQGAQNCEWIIGLRYPPPIGNIRLLLRGNGGADAFTWSEVFEHQYYRVPLATQPATILDLGANIGLSTVYFSRMFPGARLACVEPVPDNIRVLVRNLGLNGIQAEAILAAVDIEDGKVMMERNARDYGHRVATPPSRSSAAYFEVPAVGVVSILQRLGWSRIGLVKMDIEGHERRLFSENCDWLHLVDAMCLECHGEFGAAELTQLAARFQFLAPQRLAGAIWFLRR